MASVITRGLHPDALWPGVHAWFGTQYEQFEDIYSQIFYQSEGEYATERLAEGTTFGLARVKNESSPITYDTDQEGYVSTFQHTTYGLGAAVSREEMEDNLYVKLVMDRAKNLAWSMKTTIEYLHANVFINGFSNSYVYGDGSPLLSATHQTLSGYQSNLPTVNADFSEASLEDMIKRVYLAVNSRGLPVNIAPKRLIVSAADMFNATRVLQSQLRTNSANNDINAVKAMNLLPEGALTNRYFGVETTQAWFMQTDLQGENGLQTIWRRKPEIERDGEFDTENAKLKVTARLTPAVGDWRCLFGTPGV
jgi:hypothetical protein